MKLPRVEASGGVEAKQRQGLPSGTLKSALAAAVLLLGAGPGHAQDDAGPQRARSGLTIQPRLGLQETLTDNVAQSSTDRDAALVTQVSPGIRIESRAGRVRGSFDYSLNGILYTKSNAKTQTQNSLAANGTAELIENSLYVDAQASIGQQAISAFGQQSANNSLSNPNRTEVGNISVSPYWRGRLSNFASVEVRANAAATNTKQSIAGDSRTQGASVRLNGLSAGQVNWWASLSSQDSHYKLGDSNSRNSVANLGLSYQPDVDFNFTINGGPERNDYGGGSMRNSTNYGVSATWTPSPRTKLLASWQHHDYGDAHTLTFEHRRAHSLWRYSDVQSVTLGTPNGQAAGTTLFNLFYQQCIAALPDPASCSTSVNDYLLQLGLDPNTVLSSGFVASAPTLQRLQDLSFSLDGQRTSLLFSLSQTMTSLLNAAAQTGGGDLAQSSFVHQRGATVSISHRLTPDSSLYAAFSVMQNRGDTSALSNDLRSLTANWSGRLGRWLTLTLGARHTSFTGTTGYRENALTANLVQQF